jgi:hypothetical protein
VTASSSSSPPSTSTSPPPQMSARCVCACACACDAHTCACALSVRRTNRPPQDTLTDRRSMLVRNTWLAQCAARCGLDAFLLHGLQKRCGARAERAAWLWPGVPGPGHGRPGDGAAGARVRVRRGRVRVPRAQDHHRRPGPARGGRAALRPWPTVPEQHWGTTPPETSESFSRSCASVEAYPRPSTRYSRPVATCGVLVWCVWHSGRS